MTIQRQFEFATIPIRPTTKIIHPFELMMQTLESEERYLGDGFFPREDTYFSLERGRMVKNAIDSKSHGGIDIMES